MKYACSFNSLNSTQDYYNLNQNFQLQKNDSNKLIDSNWILEEIGGEDL